MAELRGTIGKILPPPGLPRTLAIQSLIYAVGNGAFLTGSVVFFSLYVGLTPIQIGIGLSAAGFVGLVGSMPFGHLADRIGGQRAWVIGALAEAAAFAAYPLADGFLLFLLVICAQTTAEALANAGRVVYTAAVVPKEGRVRVMAFNRAYLNVGFTLGSGIGAAALALDSRPGLLILVLTAAVGIALNAFFVARMPKAETPARADGPRPSPWGVLRDHPYTTSAVLIGVLWLHGTIWAEVLPLWAITMTDAPKPVLGALVALNTVMAVLLQVRAARGADTLHGATRLLRWAAIAAAIACPIVALSGRTQGWVTVAVLAAAVALLTGTELWLSSAQWYLNTEVPPADQRGAYVGLGKSVGGLAKMVGPAGFTILAIETGGWGWWVIGAIFVVCAVACRPVVRWIARTPRNEPVPVA
ncbi:MFS transporter [Actinoplanes sp. NEAU-A12]|uniref:MFS transporter n=1 Tax=Actinoplanes sandaracinus TaxID=3045177 RepID=A0ABT6WXW1_9ACTN|nr:MFS transporter [Actinoplanes sandaracinus]MDI6104451.1 MFS transporter [Actinoplanes sandaracinus]